MKTTEKLVMMANQIASFFAAQGPDRAVPQIAKHIKDFWDPRMRAGIAAHIASGGTGLSPLALTALKTIRSDVDHTITRSAPE